MLNGDFPMNAFKSLIACISRTPSRLRIGNGLLVRVTEQVRLRKFTVTIYEFELGLKLGHAHS